MSGDRRELTAGPASPHQLHSPYGRLRERVEGLLGNHHRKYLHTIATYKDSLIAALERASCLERVSLWRPSRALREDMDLVSSVATAEPQKLSFLAVYFAFQFLYLNLQSIDVLRLDLTQGMRPRHEVFRDFMIASGREFRRLTAAYMEKLLDLLLPMADRPEFVFVSVGTRSDQEDIDLGVIEDGSHRAEALNRAVGRLVSEMLRNSCRLHLYLSEHVGSRRYSASVAEFVAFNEKHVHNIVAASEVLSAAPVLGSQRLYDEFLQKVARPFYFRRGRSNFRHEAYLRGMIAEIGSQLVRPLGVRSINPKEDALRILKAAVYVSKTIYGVERLVYWEILPELRLRDPRRAGLYQQLEEALGLVEIFRHLYQLFNVQEEEIALGDDATVSSLDLVARTLGYEPVGIISAWEQMMMDYYDAVRATRRLVADLLEDAHRHLKAISVFRPALRQALTPPTTAVGAPEASAADFNLARELIHLAQRFAGIGFFADVLADLRDNPHLLERFVKDFARLPPPQLERLMRSWVDLGRSALTTIISLLLLLAHAEKGPRSRELFAGINTLFLDAAATFDAVVPRMAELFRHQPSVFQRYLDELDATSLERLQQVLLAAPLWDELLLKERERLLHLCRLHHENSHDFRRRFVNITRRRPELLPHLQDDGRLVEIAQGILGRLEQWPSLTQRRQELLDYQEIEYLRVALKALSGCKHCEIEREFVEFSDNFIARLFEITRAEVDRSEERFVPLHDALGIFFTGGAGRQQAFDDDYDLVVLLDSDDPQLHHYANRVLTRMSTVLARSGTMPHFRFTDVLGSYVTRLTELETYLRQQPEAFVDKSQLLCARMVVGSGRLLHTLEQRIIGPYIYACADSYVEDMVREMRSRHAQWADDESARLNIKECTGGLRDVESLLLMCKARYALREPVNRALVDKLTMMDERHARLYQSLGDSFEALRRLRDLYRLTSAADDTLWLDGLQRLAQVMGLRRSDDQPDAEAVLQSFFMHTQRVAAIGEELIGHLEATRG